MLGQVPHNIILIVLFLLPAKQDQVNRDNLVPDLLGLPDLAPADLLPKHPFPQQERIRSPQAAEENVLVLVLETTSPEQRI